MVIDMNKNVSVMIVGVGGQGTLLASRILGHAALESGYDVKVSEVHGMSQRGGSVETAVKFGKKIYSPVIDKGEADFILAFEPLEAARYISYIKKSGTAIVNTREIDPMPVASGEIDYPDGILDELKNKCNLVALDAQKLAKSAGSLKTVNVVMMGAAAKFFDIKKEIWETALKKSIPPKFLDLNFEAFKLGYNS